jgi:hypothetical protein
MKAEENDMTLTDFAAWSLYTGPAYLKNVIDDPNCPWVVGQWTGINRDTSVEEIRNDIDARIELLGKALRLMISGFRSDMRYFVVPEFFFRCQQGPYPDCRIDEQFTPLEYIRSRVRRLLREVIPDDGHWYAVVIGSVLTSNIQDYQQFLQSDPVKERLLELRALFLGTHSEVRPPKASFWLRNSGAAASAKRNSALDGLNDFMKKSREDPLCTVRNRGIFFCCNRSLSEDIESFVYEKQNESTVDLTMGVFGADGKITDGGMITEWMANYPSYSIIKGDKQTGRYSTASRFNPAIMPNSDIGVEICLDHRLQRLRRTVGMTKEHGADTDNYPVAVQLLPSGGMQILDYSVVADAGGVIFNADGCDKIFGSYGDEKTVILDGNAGVFRGITCGVYNRSIQSKWKGRDGQTCYSHSQLAFATQDSRLYGFNNAFGIDNIKAKTFICQTDGPYNPQTDRYASETIPFEMETELFVAGTGELHCYRPVEGASGRC